ncbi:MAG TPA: hypothetical protein VHT34_07840, partial [Clostridia bacterium]|nr:hypothetical protein [Clostridia bacterium]
MTTISLCMVVRNKNDQLMNTLETLKDIVDEIVIVNLDSGEEVRKACSPYTSRIFNFNFSQDMAACRNYSFSMAAKEHILWLDQTEYIAEAYKEKLIQLKDQLDGSVDAVKMLQNCLQFDNGVSPTILRPRIVKRDKYFQWHSGLDGHLPVKGKIIDSDIPIETDNVFSIYEQRLENGGNLSPKELYYYAEKLFEKKSDLSMEYYEKFLKEKDGWTGDKLCACERLSEFYRQRQNRESEFRYIFKSFEYDLPRAEFLCRLGVVFTELKDIPKAIFWYEMALSTKKPKDHLGYIREEYWTWLPHLKLAGCYFKTGDYNNAYRHNEAALGYMPGEAILLSNKKLLEGLLEKKQQSPSPTKKRLKIIQVAPDIYPVPPENYGGIETIILEITEELVRRGHEVILY